VSVVWHGPASSEGRTFFLHDKKVKRGEKTTKKIPIHERELESPLFLRGKIRARNAKKVLSHRAEERFIRRGKKVLSESGLTSFLQKDPPTEKQRS